MKKRLSLESTGVIVCATVLSLIGLVMQYSASCYAAETQFGDAFYYVKKQAISLVVAIVVMVGARYIKTDYLYKARYIILATSCILLAMLFIPGIGVYNYGAT